MGVGYILINNTKHECVSFAHLSAVTANEIVGNPVTAAISAWYLLKNSGDEIGFYPDSESSRRRLPFPNITLELLRTYVDVTEGLVTELVHRGILRDEGKSILDEEEPDVYVRNIRNIWME